jgi:light-regulated signal transduction histidine kinase (bacteriophytochrome)
MIYYSLILNVATFILIIILGVKLFKVKRAQKKPGRKVMHELRNSLAVIKNAVYLLDKKFEKEQDEKILTYVNIVTKELSAIDTITKKDEKKSKEDSHSRR